MSKLTVAVIFGGVSAEHEVSKMSAFNVIHSLNDEKYSIVPIYITKAGKWLLYDGALDNINHVNLEKLDTQAFICPDTELGPIVRLVGGKAKNIPVDIVFPALHGKNGEDGSIQGLCELAGIPYVGCGVLASSLCMDKAMTRTIAQSIGLKVAKTLVFTREEAKDTAAVCRQVKRKLDYPCFVKPSNTGSSIGISKATDKETLIEAINTAFNYDKKIVIEKAVSGRELECSVIGNTEIASSAVGEIIVDGGFYSYDAKYVNDGAVICTKPELPNGVSDEIKRQTALIFKAVDGLGMARVDFFLENETNNVIFNEINTIPGFTAISMYYKLWEEAGVDMSELCDRLILLGLERFKL